MNIEKFTQKVAQEEDAGTRAINDKYGVPTEEDFDFKIKNNGTGVPTEIDYGDLKEPSLSEVLMAGFKEELKAARKKEEEEETKFKKK